MLSAIDPTTLDAEAVAAVAAQLESGHLALPLGRQHALQDMLSESSAGNEVTVMSSTAVLTTAEVAELLKVSRPHVVKLVGDGSLPHHRTGSHRRIALSDLLEFKAARKQQSRSVLAEIHRLADETGMDL